MINIRPRAGLILAVPLLLIFLSIASIRNGYHKTAIDQIDSIVHPPPPKPKDSGPPPLPRHPLYKPKNNNGDAPSIIDNFPLALNAKSASELPPIPSWNKPPKYHVKEKTPLYLGFTRNWRLLQQAVVSYVTAGWPPEDIYVVENTGVMDANKKGLLSLQNPFFLNHTRLEMLGVNVIVAPTLLSFAQLQNYYLWMAITNKYPAYFWGHMDVVALPHEQADAEDPEKEYKSLYSLALDRLRVCLDPDYEVKWAIQFFAYDRLALVKTQAFEDIGGWDTQIPYYLTDCDMHERLYMAEYKTQEASAGRVFDVGTSLDDLQVLYRKEGTKPSFIDPTPPEPAAAEDDKKKKEEERRAERRWSSLMGDGHEWVELERNGDSFCELVKTVEHMQNVKLGGKKGRNTWQLRQTGGEGEPYYRDPEGFAKGLLMTIESGRSIFAEKWGHRDCNLRDVGLGLNDAWLVEHDWDRPTPEELEKKKEEERKKKNGEK